MPTHEGVPVAVTLQQLRDALQPLYDGVQQNEILLRDHGLALQWA